MNQQDRPEFDKNKMATMAKSVKNLIEEMGEDPSREGLLKTPERVAKAFLFLTKGYQEKPADIINDAIFNEEHDEIILVRDIGLYSLCEHHLLPFYGKAHVAYLPDKKIIGLSKVARIVEMFARRLQVQERLTQQIAQTLHDSLKPRGTAVIIEAEHLCMQMRGVQKRGATMVTSVMLGAFRDSSATKKELMSMIHDGK